MAQMKFQRLPTGYAAEFYINTSTVYITFKNIHEGRDNALTGVLLVKLYHNDKWHRLYTGKFNVMSSTTRERMANYLANVKPNTAEINWLEIMEKFSQSIIEAHYETPEPVRIETTDDMTPKFLLYPLIPLGHPALIFAPGGSGKSFLAMYFSLFVQNGWSLIEDGEVQQGEVMYVDWEVNLDEAKRRYTMIANGLDKEDIKFPLYKKATLPLIDELEGLLEHTAKHCVKLIIIDSAAPAVGGDINDASKVIQFFQAIRQLTDLGASVLIITHVSKADKQSDNASPVGSVFFENLSRLTWELRYTSTEKGVIDFALIPRKTNFGRYDPLGFRATFQFGIVRFEPINPDNIATNQEVVLRDLIISYLKTNPDGLTLKELAEMTGHTKSYIAKKLTELKLRNEVYNDNKGRWYLANKNEEVIDLHKL